MEIFPTVPPKKETVAGLQDEKHYGGEPQWMRWSVEAPAAKASTRRCLFSPVEAGLSGFFVPFSARVLTVLFQSCQSGSRDFFAAAAARISSTPTDRASPVTFSRVWKLEAPCRWDSESISCCFSCWKVQKFKKKQKKTVAIFQHKDVGFVLVVQHPQPSSSVITAQWDFASFFHA